jgi:hypothetical protein
MLVAACALTLDPKLMHALIWHQSGGEPWSFSVPGERQLYVYHSAREAVVEAHRIAPTGLPIRIGLTGLAVASSAAAPAMLIPCANISIAARQITHLVERCRGDPRFTAAPINCAIAASHGSWERPDSKFADAVLTSVAKGDAPNFDMSDEIDGRSDDVANEPVATGQRASEAIQSAPDEQQRGWSSALFPARTNQITGTSSNNPDTAGPQESSRFSTPPMVGPPHDDGLFVHRRPERRPQ